MAGGFSRLPPQTRSPLPPPALLFSQLPRRVCLGRVRPLHPPDESPGWFRGGGGEPQGEEEEGWGEWSGGGGRGRVIACLSVLLSLHMRERVWWWV